MSTPSVERQFFTTLAEHRSFPFLLLGFTAMTWGGNWVLARALYEELPPMSMSLARWLVAWLAMLPFALPHAVRDWPRIRGGLAPIIVLGMLGTAAFAMFGYIGIQYTSATNAVLINGATPVFNLLLAAALLGAAISLRSLVAVVMSFSGVLCIAARGDLDTLLGLKLNAGDLWILGAMFCWACYTVGLHWRPQGLHPMSFLFATATVGVLTIVPFYLWEALVEGRSFVVNARTIIGTGYLGVISTFIAYACWNAGAPRVGPQIAGLFSNLIPIFGLIFAVVFLGERLVTYHFVGMALVFGAVYLVSRSRSAVSPSRSAVPHTRSDVPPKRTP